MIVFNEMSHGRRIAAAAGAILNSDVDTVISRMDRDKLLGGVVYQDFTGASIRMHAAAFTPHWLNRDLLWVCFDYPFTQLSCTKVFLEIPVRNSKSLDFSSNLGFTREATIKEVYADCDLAIMAMHREDCRWLKINCEASRLMTEARVPSG